MGSTQRTADLGARLRQARIAAQLTQKELAERAGIGLSTLCSMEKGASRVSLDAWITISEILGLADGWDQLLVHPSDPFAAYDQELKRQNKNMKSRVRKKAK